MKERKKVDVSELRKVAVEYRSDVDVWKVAQEAESLYKAVKLLGIKNVSTVSDHVLRTGDQMSKRVRALSAYIMMHKLQMSDSALSVKRLEEIYKQYGRYLNKVDSFEFPGLTGMEKMASIMQKLRDEPLTELAGHKVVKITDYKKPEETGLPAANVLIYSLDNGATVVVRPSGTEPKIKTYFTTLGKDLAEAQAQKDALAAAIEPILA